MSTLYASKPFSFNDSIKYMIARLTRIAPAYWIAVLFVWVIYLYIPDFHYHMDSLMLMRSLLFIGNQGVLWSIPPEIQFYGFFLLLWFSCYKGEQGKYLWAVLVVCLSAILIASRSHWGGLMLPSALHIFVSGFLAALVIRHEKIKKVMGYMPFQAGITLVALAYACIFLNGGNKYTDLIFPVLVAVTIGSLSFSSTLTRPLETQTMRMMGAASFSIYLFHDPLLQLMDDLGMFHKTGLWLSLGVMCVVSIALPVTFHFLVEKSLNKFTRTKAIEHFEKAKTRWPLKKFAA